MKTAIVGAIVGAIAGGIATYVVIIATNDYPPYAIGYCTPIETKVGKKIICVNQSQYADRIKWVFDDGATIDDEDTVSHQYDKADEYLIELVAYTKGFDNSIKTIPVRVNEFIVLPNILNLHIVGYSSLGEAVEKKTIHEIHEANTEHSLFTETVKRYSKSISADDNFVIENVKIIRDSATNVRNLHATVTDDGKTANISFELVSGPLYNQYRGWLHGEVVLWQKLDQSPDERSIYTAEIVKELEVDAFGDYPLGDESYTNLDTMWVRSVDFGHLVYGSIRDRLVASDQGVAFEIVQKDDGAYLRVARAESE